MIRIAMPSISEDEINAVVDVLRSGQLTQGPLVEKFESDFAAHCGTRYAIAVSSGTAAIHTALAAVGVSAGDEVITTPFTFVGTVNPIVILGATPVFVDIDESTFTIDPEEVKKSITKKTKAIIPVHLFGKVANMQRINQIAKDHDIAVVEDAAQAVGAYDGTTSVGGLGTVGCFSLYATKNIMSVEGGMITTNEEKIATFARQFRNHGMSGPYEYSMPGLNYRMTELQAAIGILQLAKVAELSDSRRRNARLLRKSLKDIADITVPECGDASHVYHHFTIRLSEKAAKKRNEITKSLQEKGVQTGIYYPRPLHFYEHIARSCIIPSSLARTEKAAWEVLSLPVHPNVTETDIHLISRALQEALSENA